MDANALLAEIMRRSDFIFAGLALQPGYAAEGSESAGNDRRPGIQGD